jgi:polysaccharide pyruvyl transferase WcaK-like protein
MSRPVSLTDLFAEADLEHSLLIGYYGGGNYGDEFLLEVLGNLFKQQGLADIAITYQTPGEYKTFHHDFGYRLVPMHDKKALLQSIFKQKNILIGGGGLWGRDFNSNVLLLSLCLFVSRWLLGKKVYLLAVGYYSSTSWLGRIGAFLAGKAANVILARDNESLHNFRRHNRHTRLTQDIALYANGIDPESYAADVARLERQLKVTQKTLFFTLRKLGGYYNLVGECIRQNPDKPIIAGLLVPRRVRPDGYALLADWQKQHPNVRVFDLTFNPLALFYFFRKHHKNLVLIGPQYHIIVTAHVNGVPFLPVTYDNKVAELLGQFKDTRRPIPIGKLTLEDTQDFIDDIYGRKA